jgi:hydroxymethylglutaryl-CoA reductase
VDVCEAMGANVVNAVAEGMADRVAALAGGRVGLRILSNLAVHRRASVRPPTTSMRDNDSRE